MINIQINSSLVKKGDTFVAIKGKIVDGNDYIEDAIKNGATKIITTNSKKYSVETINVDDSYKYLKNYLVYKYSKTFANLKFIGITGTNGKTTTAYMTYELLCKLNIKTAYIGTLGFYYNGKSEDTLNTTPDILNMYKCIEKAKENGCKIIILEASSIGLAEDRLAGIKFDIAVFTNLTHDHLDYHLTMDNYFEAKNILFKNLKDDGIAIINNDDKYSKRIVANKIITYGFRNSTIKCISHNNICSKFTYQYDNNTYNIESKLFGKYNIYNIMASIGILINLKTDINTINSYYKDLSIPNGRQNIVHYKTNKIIIDYAHTPDGIKQILTSAKYITKGKIYVVFGCPGDRDRAKRPEMSKIVNKYSDYFIITDDDPHYEDELQIVRDAVKGLKSHKYEVIINRKLAIAKAMKLLNKNDTLLILGKGHENAIIIKNKRIHHNDLEFVNEIIKQES